MGGWWLWNLALLVLCRYLKRRVISEVHEVWLFCSVLAVAGEDVTIALPQTWAMLDGSASSDDVSLVSYAWRQLSGPTPAVLLPANASRTNATSLTKGQYRFQLTVTDSDGNLAVNSVTVTVTQSKLGFFEPFFFSINIPIQLKNKITHRRWLD